jgi:hypothetical protein
MADALDGTVTVVVSGARRAVGRCLQPDNAATEPGVLPPYSCSGCSYNVRRALAQQRVPLPALITTHAHTSAAAACAHLVS